MCLMKTGMLLKMGCLFYITVYFKYNKMDAYKMMSSLATYVHVTSAQIIPFSPESSLVQLTDNPIQTQTTTVL